MSGGHNWVIRENSQVQCDWCVRSLCVMEYNCEWSWPLVLQGRKFSFSQKRIKQRPTLAVHLHKSQSPTVNLLCHTVKLKGSTFLRFYLNFYRLVSVTAVENVGYVPWRCARMPSYGRFYSLSFAFQFKPRIHICNMQRNQMCVDKYTVV